MTFFHDSTSGLNGQNAPSNSVKTPKPDLLTEKEYYQIITLLTSSNHDLAIKMAYTWGSLISLLEINGHCLPDGVIPQNLRPQLVPLAEAEAVNFAPHFEVMDYPEIETLSEYERATLIQSLRHYFDLLDKHTTPGKEIVLRDVTKLQNKLLDSMPIKSPMPTAVVSQLDRMEALLLEIKAGFTFNP